MFKKMVDRIKYDQDLKDTAISVSVLAVIGLAALAIMNIVDKKKSYNEAAELFANGEYSKARGIFRALGNYKLSKDYQALCTKELGDSLDDEDEEDLFFENLNLSNEE